MLKTLRVILAIVSLLTVTALFVDVTGTASAAWPWMAKIQLVPAILSANFIALAILLALTVLFGRIYCSVICPLGVMQDVIIRLRGWLGGAKKKRVNRFNYAPPATKLRVTILLIFSILLLLGVFSVLISAIAGLIEPYSAYGRIASQLFAPGIDAVNNSLADSQVDFAGHSFMPVVWRMVVPVFIIAAITFIVIALFAWIGDRDYCNKICPVGTLLGYISKIAIFKIKIDTDKCNGCKKCARNCKSKCIDPLNHTIDPTRCVVCMDCIGKCSTGAISYGLSYGKTKVKTSPKETNTPANQGRRAFMVGGATIAGALALKAAEHGDGALAAVRKKAEPKRKMPVIPAGAQGLSHLADHCTGCQLCIQNCPEGLLTASTNLQRFMQPELNFDNGYCPVWCHNCGEVCPTGAILPLDDAEKSSVKIGTAKVRMKMCISASKDVDCGNCARHCPTGAIEMTKITRDGRERLMPVVYAERCIGCGACEYHCPVGSVESLGHSQSAIIVNGAEVHQTV